MTEYKSYTSQALIEEVKSSDRLTMELIEECFRRGNVVLNKALETKAIESEEVREQIHSLHPLPFKGSVLYYPNQNRFEYIDISEVAEVTLSEKAIKKYKSIDDSSEFYLKLTVSVVPGQILTYKVFEKQEEEKSFLFNAHVGNAATLALALSAAILFYKGADLTSSANAALRPASISMNESFLSGYDVVFHDLKKAGVKIDPSNELKASEVKLVASLMAENDDETPQQVNMLSESDMIHAIEDIISPYVKDKKKVAKIAKSIHEASQERQVDYLLFLSIMKVETTTFNQDAVSSSGDLSIAQIKPEVWQDEFARLGKEPLDVARLKKDPSYAIDRMGEILELQNKYKEKDPYWYARYHSKTPSRKIKYAKKVQQEYLRMKEAQIHEIENKISNTLNQLEKIDSEEFDLSISYARHLLVNKGKIEQYKEELKKMKSVIGENKSKKMREIVAKL